MQRLTFIIVTAFVAAVCAAQTQPTTGTTPRDAIKAFRVAVEAADASALRNLVFAADEDQRKLNDALAGVIAASSRLSAAANARFGDSSDPIAGKTFSPADLAGMDSAPLEEHGDVATIKLPTRDQPLTLRRDQDGSWRIDLLTFTGFSRRQFPQQLSMFHEFSAALNQLATDTRDGRFVSVADLKAAIQDRVHGTIARSMRQAKPTTAPSTHPTTAPARP